MRIYWTYFWYVVQNHQCSNWLFTINHFLIGKVISMLFDDISLLLQPSVVTYRQSLCLMHWLCNLKVTKNLLITKKLEWFDTTVPVRWYFFINIMLYYVLIAWCDDFPFYFILFYFILCTYVNGVIS